MRYGAYLYGDPHDTERESRVLERHGFSTIWFGEAPTMGFGDAFQGMADAARATSVRVGTAITAAGVRHPATVVNQLGTLNSSAPGRVTFGVGTGLLTRRILGLPPLRLVQFRDEVEQLRLLLDGDVAHVDGQPIAFREPRGGVRLDPPIDLWVAAGGPRTAAVAGEFGDGMLTTGVFDLGELRTLHEAAAAAATAASRAPEEHKFCLEAGPLCVVREGEDLRSTRVLDLVEPILTLYFILWAALGSGPAEVPAPASDTYAIFLREVEAEYGPDAGNQIFGLSAAALRRQHKNDRFFPPKVIEACTLTGHDTDLRDRIADMAKAGLTDIAVLRGRTYRWSEGSDLDDLVRLIEAT